MQQQDTRRKDSLFFTQRTAALIHAFQPFLQCLFILFSEPYIGIPLLQPPPPFPLAFCPIKTLSLMPFILNDEAWVLVAFTEDS